MQLIAEIGHLRSLRYELFHVAEFLDASGLETTRIVENESRIALEYQLILDVVNPALREYELTTDD
jgi:hypothetical protein